MYSTIFKYEFNYWLKQPSTYVYAFFLCLFPMLQAAGQLILQYSDLLGYRAALAPYYVYKFYRLSIIVKGKPVEVWIAPYVKMIDKNGRDNRMLVD